MGIFRIFIAGNLVYLFHIHVFLNLVELFVGLINPSLKDKIDTYMDFFPNMSFAISIGYLERLLTGILIFCYLNKLREMRKGNDLYYQFDAALFFMFFFFFSEFRSCEYAISPICSVLLIGRLWIDLDQVFFHQ
jgi:hypothetical protein